MASLIAIPLYALGGWFGLGLPFIVTFTLGITGLWLGVQRGRDMKSIFPALESKRTQESSPAGRSGSILVDTSAIIDGRIADLTSTGFVEGTLVVPRFVLDELRHIADSSDPLRRNRGRRGLEVLGKLRGDDKVSLEVLDVGVDPGGEVDSQLVKLARSMNSSILTTDYNLNRVAELQGVQVLNVNELANALKSVVLPGEEMRVNIVQEGKEAGQGVAYLELKNYYDAERVLQGYILDYRGGRYEEEAALYCAAIATARAELGHAAEARLEAAIGDLNRLLELEKEHPSDPEIKYQLGNIYYEVGEYEDAGKKYFEAQELEAAYRQNELVMRRLFINDQGEPEALSPGALQRIERERHPLVIFDKMTYYQRRTSSSFSARQVYAVLTGKVRNQGSQSLRGVTIEVRFLNARNQILDVQPVQIGTLGPGEVRAFLARASNYDSLLNITRIDTIARSDP
ncbi:hypothetical protein IIC65_07945 [Candidatus Sumerlaeota bacterium]|nr:hypothetical protein [Candidatus Sumerlaeota bacterium]